jgi:16S rRNA G966 N2-methylase RsmD
VSVVSQEVLRWLQQPPQGLKAFDLIYADPPYAAGLYGPICRALRDGEWLRPSGLLLLECSSDGVPPLEAGWQLNKQKRYGGSTVLLLQRL